MGVFTADALAAGVVETIKVSRGERPYFLTVMGEPVGGVNGRVAFWNRSALILPGSRLTLGGDDWPPDCEEYAQSSLFQFTGGLGPMMLIWGPILRGWNPEHGGSPINARR